MTAEMAQLILVTIVTAATPLFLAALGELVAERSGVLNLGVEGMRVRGAAAGCAGAYETDSNIAGALAGIAAGTLMAALFGVLTVVFAVSQVASGLALTIFGLGLSGLLGSGFVGLKRQAAPHVAIPGLTDLPVVGRLVFGEDYFVYFAIALAAAVAYGLKRTRAGLVLRAVGDNHGSAHALGVPVRRVRMLAVLFGGACAGLGGAYLSLVYTPFWSPEMTAGRGWIALALVVFASWRPWRAMGGAVLFGGATVLQLHAQAFGIGLPGQFMSAVPDLAPGLARVGRARRRGAGAVSPAMLGTAFVPDR